MGVLYLICWRRNYPHDGGTRPDMAMNASGIRDTARGTRAYGERGGRMSATLQGVVRLPLSSDSLVSVRAQFFDHLVVQPKD
jgi:hypothetical protein